MGTHGIRTLSSPSQSDLSGGSDRLLSSDSLLIVLHYVSARIREA